MVCWIEGGAGFFFFLALLPGGAVELPGRSRPAPGVVAIRWVISVDHVRCWSRAREVGRAMPTDLLGPPARCSGNSRKTRRLLTNRPCSSFSTKSPIPTNVYASAIGLCKDFITMQSRKPSNSDF